MDVHKVMHKTSGADAVRVRLEGLYGAGRRLRPSLWAYLQDQHYVSEVLEGESTIRDLKRVADEIAEAGGGAATEATASARVSRQMNPPLRPRSSSDLIAQLLAERATTEPQVQRFRQRHLPDGLLASVADVERWLLDRVSEQRNGERVWLVGVAVDAVQVPVRGRPDGSLIVGPPLPESISAERIEARFLEFETTDEPGRPDYLPIEPGRVLDELRGLAIHLADAYNWSAAQATTFVLNGAPPHVAPATIQLTRGRFGANVRLVLTIDPTMAPAEVAQMYTQLRANLFGGRYRHLSDKHLELARFSLERLDSETWSQAMDRWNGAFPGWRYTQASNFRRDVGRARQRVLEPPFDEPYRDLASDGRGGTPEDGED